MSKNTNKSKKIKIERKIHKKADFEIEQDENFLFCEWRIREMTKKIIGIIASIIGIGVAIYLTCTFCTNRFFLKLLPVR